MPRIQGAVAVCGVFVFRRCRFSSAPRNSLARAFVLPQPFKYEYCAKRNEFELICNVDKATVDFLVALLETASHYKVGPTVRQSSVRDVVVQWCAIYLKGYSQREVSEFNVVVGIVIVYSRCAFGFGHAFF